MHKVPQCSIRQAPTNHNAGNFGVKETGQLENFDAFLQIWLLQFFGFFLITRLIKVLNLLLCELFVLRGDLGMERLRQIH